MLVCLSYSLFHCAFSHVSPPPLVGNEESDVECLKKAGISGVPADACTAAQHAVGFICKCSGGRGAIREFAEHILLLTERSEFSRKENEELIKKQ